MGSEKRKKQVGGTHYLKKYSLGMLLTNIT